MIISGAEPVWLVPNRFEEWGIWGNITPDMVEQMLEKLLMLEWFGLQTLPMRGLFLT